MIDFSRPYTSKWKVVSVDPDTWDDAYEIPGVYSASISTDGTDSIPLLETASLEIDSGIYDTFSEGWYRILMIAIQDSYYERYPLSTVLFQGSSDVVAFGKKTDSISGSSVLKPVADLKNIGNDYRYAPKGVDGADWVADILNANIPSSVYIEGDGFKLTDAVTFSPGTSYLEMIWSVLDAGNWCMSIDGEGDVTIKAKPSQPDYVFDRTTMKNIQPSIKRTLSYEDVCNRYYAIDKMGNMEIAENHDPNSPLSYENRGRWVDYVDTSPKKINGETLYSYARRRLQQESVLIQTYSYTREYIPGIYPFSLISGLLPEYGIDGDLRVFSQNIACDKGIVVSETAGLEIKGWVA